MAKKILLTGACGKLGQILTSDLVDAGYQLVLTDCVEAKFDLPPRTEFFKADLADTQAIRALVSGVDVILHFGGISVERHWSEVLPANIIGTINIFEAANEHRCRVVFASSNHTIGYHERTTVISTESPYRPDGYYGLSKAYGELLARMMFDKHGVESVSLRIGSAEHAPSEARHEATWLCMDDLKRMVRASIDAPDVGCSVLWGVSKNQTLWWVGDDAEKIGFAPQTVGATPGSLPEKGDDIAARYQGGSFASNGFTRVEPAR